MKKNLRIFTTALLAVTFGIAMAKPGDVLFKFSTAVLMPENTTLKCGSRPVGDPPQTIVARSAETKAVFEFLFSNASSSSRIKPTTPYNLLRHGGGFDGNNYFIIPAQKVPYTLYLEVVSGSSASCDGVNSGVLRGLPRTNLWRIDETGERVLIQENLTSEGKGTSVVIQPGIAVRIENNDGGISLDIRELILTEAK